jgi:hypothetical protein
MSGTYKTAAKNKNDVEIDNPQSRRTLHQPELIEDDRDDDVTNSSKKPSTQRWMIQKRQVSAMV